jgi:hypothetical protein
MALEAERSSETAVTICQITLHKRIICLSCFVFSNICKVDGWVLDYLVVVYRLQSLISVKCYKMTVTNTSCRDGIRVNSTAFSAAYAAAEM